MTMTKKVTAAHFQLTVRCNLHCSFCGQSRGMAGFADNEISPKQWLFFAEQLREISGVPPTITLWGGEPMLYDQFNYLARQLRELGHPLQTVTNATMLENSADILCRCFDTVFISLDGLEKHHDAVRGKGVFNAVCNNLKLLDKRCGKVIFLCTVSDTNVDVLPEILPQMAKLGCDGIVLQQLMYLSSSEIERYRTFSREFFGCDYPELTGWMRDDDSSYRNKLLKMLAEINEKKYTVPVIFTPHACLHGYDTPCKKQLERIHIRHDGETGFCTDYFGFSAGNAKSSSLHEIIYGSRAELFHSAVESGKLPICSHCPWRMQ